MADRDGYTGECTDPAELCRMAGREPDEQLTRFVLEDVASALIDDEHSEEEVIDLLRNADAGELGNAICDNAGWGDILTVAITGAWG